MSELAVGMRVTTSHGEGEIKDIDLNQWGTVRYGVKIEKWHQEEERLLYENDRCFPDGILYYRSRFVRKIE